MEVIITVPHSKCKLNHYCDKKAQEFAEKLQGKLGQIGIVTTLFIASINRSDCDINRPQCRSKSFRPKYTKLLCSNNKNKNNTLIFDVHSFPSDDIRLSKYDLFFIELPPPSNVAKRLLREFRERKISSTIKRGTNDNDILFEARDWGFGESTLIEVNNGIADKTLNKVLNIIQSYVQQKNSINESCIII